MFKRVFSTLLALSLCVCALSSCENVTQIISGDKVLYTDAVISELMADNASTLKDGAGAYSDWIEIYNPTSSTIDLTGYGISDNANQPFKYTLPEIKLKAKEFIIVFMDGENRYNDGELHGSFKLSSLGDETVTLTNPSGRQLSAVTVASCPADISVGLVMEGKDQGDYVYFSVPTPGKKNEGAYTYSPEKSDAVSDVTLYINEYMKSKNNVFLDEDGDYSAFVELYNPSEEKVSISGFYLSDDSAEPDKWQFPEGTEIEGKGYLTVYLSGKDKVTDTGKLHASFKFSSTDTALLLSDKLLRKVDAIEPVELTANLSYGRSLDDAEKWLYFSIPTPSKANTGVGFEDLASGVVTSFGENVYVSEAMASNSSAHKSPAGDYCDWIELHNPTDKDIDLSGYFISDDIDEPYFFEFPSGTEISAGGYLTLYASGMAGRGKNNEIYLPFSLSADGETICLTSSESLTVDIFQTGRLRKDTSSGRVDNKIDRVFFTTATPNNENSREYNKGYSSLPLFSSDGGCVESDSVTLTLTANEDAVIYYTLDGSEPTEDSSVYTKPITVTKNCVVRAKAKEEDRLMSDVCQRTFIFNESHDLPVFCVSSDADGLFSDKNGIYAMGYGASSEFPYKGANFWKDWERAAGFEYYTEEGDLGITFNAGLSIHGQYSRAQSQKSFKVKLRSEYGTSQISYPFFKDYDVSSFKSFVLRSGGQDYNSCKLRDAFFMQVIKGQMDVDYMEYRFCALYINGEYWGLYCIREHTNADYIEAHHGIDADNVDLLKGNSSVKEGSKDAYNELMTFMKTHDLTVQENYEYAKSKIDLESFKNWWITETFFSNTDTGNIKFYCEKSETGKWRWILFDMDWGMWPSTYHRNRIDRMLDPEGHGTGSMFSTVFARKLMENEEFKNDFIESYAWHLNNTFTPERMNGILDRMADEIRTEIPKNYDRWGELRPTSWEKNINRLKELLAERVELSKKHLKATFKLSDERMAELFPEE